MAPPVFTGAEGEPFVGSLFAMSPGSGFPFPLEILGLLCPLPVRLCGATEGAAECDFEFRPDCSLELEAWLCVEFR